jgi:CheY-like chemotaxis protein
MHTTTPDFIVIDDSKLDCFIAEKIIKNTGNYKSQSFMEAAKVIDLLKNPDFLLTVSKTIIILDIQMPVMNGFQFAEEFEKLPQSTKDKFDIFMISSSVNDSDRSRINNYPSINKLQIKPLSKTMVSEMVDYVIAACL